MTSQANSKRLVRALVAMAMALAAAPLLAGCGGEPAEDMEMDDSAGRSSLGSDQADAELAVLTQCDRVYAGARDSFEREFRSRFFVTLHRAPDGPDGRPAPWVDQYGVLQSGAYRVTGNTAHVEIYWTYPAWPDTVEEIDITLQEGTREVDRSSWTPWNSNADYTEFARGTASGSTYRFSRLEILDRPGNMNSLQWRYKGWNSKLILEDVESGESFEFHAWCKMYGTGGHAHFSR